MDREERWIQRTKIVLGIVAISGLVYAIHLLHVIAYGK
jgi:hypothetical protein